MQGSMSLGGRVAVKKIKARGPGLRWQLANYSRPGFIKAWLAVTLVQPIARFMGLLTGYGSLYAVVVKADGTRINYGLLDHRVITTAYVTFLALMHQTDATTVGDYKFHDGGVGTTAPAIGDTTMETTDGEARATGTQVASTNTYTSVGTVSYTTTKAVTEHGLFNDVTAGTLMDRSTFSAVNVVNGDSIQFTYVLTLTAGG